MKFKDIEEISNLDMTNFGYDELKEVAEALFPVINQRMRRLKKAGLEGVPAIRGLQKARGMEDGLPTFSMRFTNNRNKLLSQVIMAQNFNKDITSSVSSTRKQSREFWKRYGFKKPPMSEKEMWEEFRKFEEADNGTKFSKAESNFAVSKVRTVWDNPELRERFLTENEYRQEILDDIYNYKQKLGLEPKQENITEDFREMT